MPRGRRPTAIVAIAPTVRGEITVMLLLTSLLTYNTGSGVGATSAAPTSGATSRRTALPRHEPDVIAPSRSIVEDRLIDVDRPVEPPDAVAPADVAQHGAVQVGAGDIRVRQVRADEIGADQQDLAEVRTREVRAARSEEHTSELQSPCNLVCRLLLEKKKKIQTYTTQSSGKD